MKGTIRPRTDNSPADERPEGRSCTGVREFLAAVKRRSESWPRRRRIRALQELLLDANDLVLHVVDGIELLRSGRRLSGIVRQA